MDAIASQTNRAAVQRHREPLFLGEPANYAAKRSGGGKSTGIYLTNTARKIIGLADASNVDTTPLTTSEIETSQKEAKLDVTADEIVKEWKEDLKNNPIAAFEFSGHTPPYASLDIEGLSAKNSRRQDACTVYGDIDGFTKYVGAIHGTYLAPTRPLLGQLVLAVITCGFIASLAWMRALTLNAPQPRVLLPAPADSRATVGVAS